jgi:hypothetical protein
MHDLFSNIHKHFQPRPRVVSSRDRYCRLANQNFSFSNGYRHVGSRIVGYWAKTDVFRGPILLQGAKPVVIGVLVVTMIRICLRWYGTPRETCTIPRYYYLRTLKQPAAVASDSYKVIESSRRFADSKEVSDFT